MRSFLLSSAALFSALLLGFIPEPSLAMQGVNCFGPSPVKLDLRGFNTTQPNFVAGNPAATEDLWAAISMPVNFTVAFLGDSGKDPSALDVLRLIKDSGAHMALHSGVRRALFNPSISFSLLTGPFICPLQDFDYVSTFPAFPYPGCCRLNALIFL